jgi:ElaB/YqjD/DUF883 family membrane-anchored ribosome-binding protein
LAPRPCPTAVSERTEGLLNSSKARARYHKNQSASRPRAAASVDKYCREHPLDSLAVAAEHLVDTLSEENKRSSNQRRPPAMMCPFLVVM